MKFSNKLTTTFLLGINAMLIFTSATLAQAPDFQWAKILLDEMK